MTEKKLNLFQFASSSVATGTQHSLGGQTCRLKTRCSKASQKSVHWPHGKCKLLTSMKRRDFLFAAAVAGVPQSSFDFSLLPNFCSHEHWGSIDSIGTFPGGYRADIERGAVPRRRTGFMDLVLDPYFRGWLRDAGADLTRISPSAEPGWDDLQSGSPSD